MRLDFYILMDDNVRTLREVEEDMTQNFGYEVRFTSEGISILLCCGNKMDYLGWRGKFFGRNGSGEFPLEGKFHYCSRCNLLMED